VKILVLTTAIMKMAALWHIAPCSLVKVDYVSEIPTVSIFRVILMRRQAIPQRQSTSTTLHGAISHKGVIFM
jgi:hypothetical protein